MAKGLIDVLLDAFFTNERVGRIGETMTASELKWARLFGNKGNILRNVYVPKDDGETAEIDLLYITKKGIIVFESKNYSGWIFGDERSKYWTTSLPNGEKNRFYNPILQNRTHLKWLSAYLEKEIPLFSVIVFSERCELKRVTCGDPNVKVIKRDCVISVVNAIRCDNPDVLSNEEVDVITARLKKLTNVDEAVKEAHIKSIEERYKKPAPIPGKSANKEKPEPAGDPDGSSEDDSNNIGLICPLCGNKLVLRTAKKGPNAGKRFYGCSGFPNCKYTKNV